MSDATMPLELLEWRPRVKGALRGFAKVRVGRSLVIHDVAVLVNDRGAWASPPAKPLIDATGSALRDDKGKIKYTPAVEKQYSGNTSPDIT